MSLLVGCSGSIAPPDQARDDDGEDSSSDGDGDEPSRPNPPRDQTPPDEVVREPNACQDLGAASAMRRPAARLRRLNRTELANAIADLLGAPLQSPELPRDLDGKGVLKAAQILTVKGDFLEAYWDVTEAAAEKLMATPAIAPKCGAEDTGCVRGFAKALAAKAWRRDVTDAEVTDLMASYDKGKAMDQGTGFRFVVQRVLLSPEFLYLKEDGVLESEKNTSVHKLGPFHVAEQLSFLLWSAPPDAPLLQAARDGKLSKPADVRAQAARMLGEPRARAAVGDFFEAWLALGDVRDAPKSSKAFPAATPDILGDMAVDARSTLDAWFFGDAQGPASLFTGKRAHLTARLARFLGVSPPQGATDTVAMPTELPDRMGVLTQPAFLALASKPDQNSTVLRGKFVTEHLLCGTIPKPPEGVDLAAADPGFAPGLSLRERMERHNTEPACASCHQVFEPIGFALESYDAVGKRQTMDAGKPINDTVTVKNFFGLSGTYQGVAEMAPALAKTPSAEACYVLSLGRHALGRELSEEAACLAFGATGTSGKEAPARSMKELLLDFVASPAFLERSPATKEAL